MKRIRLSVVVLLTFLFTLTLTQISCTNEDQFLTEIGVNESAENSDEAANEDEESQDDSENQNDSGDNSDGGKTNEPPVYGELKAFPSAYGAGAYTTGGRGGVIVHVTNLNDSGSGSLREALKMTVPRIIVFDVSGVINLNSMIYLNASNSNVTIAGQTAPEGGITIDGNRLYFDGVDNVICRFIRFRGGVDAGNDPFSAVGNITNYIFDHCSFSFDGDETGDWSNNDPGDFIDNITIQRCIFGEGSKGVLFGSTSPATAGDLSFNHNLFYNITHRTPNSYGYGPNARVEIINNVVWTIGWRLIRANGDQKLNHIGNYYDFGTNPIQDTKLNLFAWESNIMPEIYTSGNKIVAQNTGSPLTYSVSEMNTDNTKMWKFFLDAGGYEAGDQLPSNYFTDTQHPLLGAATPIFSADEAFNNVLADVGCNKRLNADGTVSSNVDELDLTWLSMVNQGLYIPRVSSSNYNVPSIAPNYRPSDYDTDRDGMPDVWELATFGNLDRDGLGDFDGDGYTDIEEFLNLVDI